MKTLNYNKSFFAILLILSTINSYGQTDWKEKLTKNIVKVENGKYSVEEYTLFTIENKASIQFKTSAVAPIDVLSRDKFVSFYSSYTTLIMLTAILSKGGIDLSNVNSKALDKLIGQPDISIHLELTNKGIQIQLTTDEGTSRQTMTWEEFYKEK